MIIGDKTYFLAPTEAKLLLQFLRNEGEVQHGDQLYEAACSRDWTLGDRTIDVLVSRLRRKLAGSSAEIVTLQQAGYPLSLVEVENSILQTFLLEPTGSNPNASAIA